MTPWRQARRNSASAISEDPQYSRRHAGGPLPPSLQVYTSFGAAVSANARDAAAAQSMIRVLTSQAAAAVITAKGMQPAAAPDRLPPIPVSQMTDAQKKAAEEFKVIRNGAEVSGPFFPLLRSPELMVRASARAILRYRSSCHVSASL